jgi:hypothetical protein
MMAQFQAQEQKVTQGLKQVQASSLQERTLLHQQLQDANAKLALDADALTKANTQTAEISRMEQDMHAMTSERDTNAMTIQQLQAQITQSESDKKMQIDRANERLKNYERALFDTRQVLAMKDAKIATLESNVKRLSAGKAASPRPVGADNITPHPGSIDGSVTRASPGPQRTAMPEHLRTGSPPSVSQVYNQGWGPDPRQQEGNKRVSFREDDSIVLADVAVKTTPAEPRQYDPQSAYGTQAPAPAQFQASSLGPATAGLQGNQGGRLPMHPQQAQSFAFSPAAQYAQPFAQAQYPQSQQYSPQQQPRQPYQQMQAQQAHLNPAQAKEQVYNAADYRESPTLQQMPTENQFF